MKHASNNKGSMVFGIITIALLVAAHVMLGVLVFLSYRYYNLGMKLFMSAVGLAVTILLIIDIIFFVGFNHRDNPLKAIVLVLSVIMVAISSVGTYYVHQINKNVDNLIDNEGEDQYETINGVIATYDTVIKDLKDLEGKKVGILNETTVGTSTIAQEKITAEGTEATFIPFNTMDNLLLGLVEKTIDAAVFPASYRQKFNSEEDSDYSQYLDKLNEFYTFEEKVLTGQNAKSNLDLSTEPFNILLIGFAPETADNSYGLADSIIIASVNPKMMSVTLTSIARDSYVPISCWGGATEKINAARGTSRACLIETVENLMNVDIDFYMEVNFQGVVDIVDAVGGIVITSPVAFVGQTPSAERGHMNVYVPAGTNPVNGEQALAFARERHQMPNGDFDRQQHQQEVIKAIADKMIESKDINVALKALEAAGNNFSTNLSLSQMTNIFNYIINIKNYTGLRLSNIIDIRGARVTGYPSWIFNYSMKLKLWIYKLFKGSIAENRENIRFVMQEVTSSEIEQDSGFRFFATWPYYRDYYYHDWFDEPQEHAKMPDLVPNMIGMTLADAKAAAAEVNLGLSVVYLRPGDAGYDKSMDGLVVDQNVPKNELVADFPNVTITVMGDLSTHIVDCNSVDGCKLWAEEHVAGYEIQEVIGVEGEDKIDDFAGTNPKNGAEITGNQTLIIYVVGKVHQHQWEEWKTTVEPTCTTPGSRTRTCLNTSDGIEPHSQTEEIPALGHQWGELIIDTEARPGAPGQGHRVCSVCGETITEEIPALPEPTPEPDPNQDQNTVPQETPAE